MTHTAEAKTSDIPLAIWPCAQRTSQWQRHGRYVPELNRHPGKMLPDLARRAIESYSEPGDLVVDPMCGIGTTIAEAVRLDRNAIGVELEPRWSRLAARNVAYARSRRGSCAGTILTGDARRLPRLLASKAVRSLCEPPAGNVARLPYAIADLVLTSPPYGCEVGDVDRSAWHTGRKICPEDSRNYSPDKENVGHARGDSYAAAMLEIYRACAAVTKPGGFVVVVTKNTRTRGAMRNLAGETIALCEQAGLRYWQHVIGLLATIRGDTLVPRPSFWQLLQTRRGIQRGERPHLVCHEDVLVFRKPASQTAAVAVETRQEAC